MQNKAILLPGDVIYCVPCIVSHMHSLGLLWLLQFLNTKKPDKKKGIYKYLELNNNVSKPYINTVSAEALKQDAQRSHGHPIPGHVQGQVGQGLELDEL